MTIGSSAKAATRQESGAAIRVGRRQARLCFPIGSPRSVPAVMPPGFRHLLALIHAHHPPNAPPRQPQYWMNAALLPVSLAWLQTRESGWIPLLWRDPFLSSHTEREVGFFFLLAISALLARCYPRSLAAFRVHHLILEIPLSLSHGQCHSAMAQGGWR